MKFSHVSALSLILLCQQSFAESNEPVGIEEMLDATVEFDMPLEIEYTTEKSDETPFRDKDLRFGLAYQAGLDLNKLDSVTSNRFDSRLQWEKLLQKKFYITADGKFIVRFNGDQNLDNSETYSTEFRVKDFNVQTQVSQLGIKAGYQTIIWGEMDSAPINDVMSPWDYSEFAFTTPEDARIGQGSVVIDLFSSQTNLSLVFTPYPLANRFPGGEASALLAIILGSDNYTVNDNYPRLGKDYELGARLKHTIGSFDIAIYAAQIRSDFPRFELLSLENSGTPNFDLSYPQYESIGFSGNYSKGSFLWKYENAFKNNVYFPSQTAVFRDTMENAIGTDYNANGAYNLSLELYNQTILKGAGQLTGYKSNNSQLMMRWSKNYLHDTLSAIYYFSYQLQYEDMTQSLALQYAINDYWRIDLNATLFDVKNNDSPNAFIDDWDQVSFRINLTI